MKKNPFSLVLSFVLMALLSSCQFFSAEKKEGKDKEVLTAGVDGVQKKYRANKTLLSTIEYKDKKRHGIARSYYEDGKTIQNEISYKMGIKNGITKSYYKSGRLYYLVNYIDGKRQGLLKKYYDTGELMAEIPYKNSEVQEGLIEYQKSGKKKVLYPHIVFEEIDKTASENVYVVRVKLSDSKKNVKFYRILVTKNGEVVTEKMLVNDGVAEVKFNVRGKHTIDLKIRIKAEITTFLRNPYITYKEKHLKVYN